MAPSAVFGQTAPDATAVTSPESTTSASVQRFEIGARAAVAVPGPGTGLDKHLKYFGGISATYALRSWLAVGTETEALQTYTGEYWALNCHACIRIGIQTLALGELRVPLGYDAVRLFGRVAVGPAFVERANSVSSVVAAARASVGVDLRLWHIYGRPFGFVGTVATNGPQLGFGFETGAVF